MPRSTSTGCSMTANELNRRSNVRLLSARASSNPIVQQMAALGLAGVLLVGESRDRHAAR